MSFDEQEARRSFLIRNRDSKFTRGFDDVFRSEAWVIDAPIAAPKAKSHAERWVGTVWRECLRPSVDRLPQAPQASPPEST
jgi:putative transposase